MENIVKASNFCCVKSFDKMGSKLRKIIGFSAASCLLNLMPVGHAMAFSFSDGFEGGVIDPFWTVNEDFGSVSLSTSQAHGGSQSVRMSSTSGGQRYVWLNHSFSEAMIGTVSVWFYDAYPGQPTLYSAVFFHNAGTPTNAWIGVQDWDPTYYHAVSYGPQAPNEGQTGLARSLGWHHFEAYFGQGKTEVSIDSVVVSSYLGGQGTDDIHLMLFGPGWRPNSEVYFDDFQLNMTPLAAIPEPETYAMMLAGLGLLGVVARRRKQKAFA